MRTLTISRIRAILERCLGPQCGLCRSAEGIIHVDHDHATGIVRGLLCARCNQLEKRTVLPPEWLAWMADPPAPKAGLLFKYPVPKVPAGPVPHGTTNGYANYRCRCAECREANNARMKAVLSDHPEYRKVKNERQRQRRFERIALEPGYLERERAASREYDAKHRERDGAVRRAQHRAWIRMPQAPCCTRSYSSYGRGCRCDDCRQARKAGCAERYAARQDLRAAASARNKVWRQANRQVD